MRHRHFHNSPTKIVAAIELVIASGFWGLGYVASKWALVSMGPFSVAFLRFVIALAFALLWVLWASRTAAGNNFKAEFWRSRQAGLALGAMVVLQTLALQYTSVTRCGFLSGLYVVFVPILEALMLRSMIQPRLGLWIAVATLGTCLMCGYDGGQGWNAGDTFALACAVVAAVQIVLVDKTSGKIASPFSFNAGQSFWACLPGLIFMIAYAEVPRLPWTGGSWLGIAILSIGCTLTGFWLQIRAQKILSATVVSILFLLESPSAGLFGYIFFDERMSSQQFAGAALILLACWNTVALDRKTTKRT